MFAAAAWAPLDPRVIARSFGNDLPTARRIASVILSRPQNAQILSVRCERVAAHVDCGIVLSGVKFHHTLDVDAWNGEVASIVADAYGAAPHVDEIDCWATVPLDVGRGTVVSGDYAKPTSATVFSITVPRGRQKWVVAQLHSGRGVFWDPAFRSSLAKGTRE